jgi:glucoamylase
LIPSRSVFASKPFRGADSDVLQVGVVVAVIPDPEHPEYSVYWLRDACLVYHPWLNELTVFGDKSLRSQLDDVVHVLTRTQQVVSLAGNVFTGGIAEAVFGVQLQMILEEKTRIGSPAAGAWTWRLCSSVV